MKDTITHLRELLSKGTPGPWRYDVDNKNRHAIRHFPEVYEPVVYCDRDGGSMKEVNAELIVAAVNGLPALLDRLEKLERRRLLGMPHTHLTGADCSRCDEADELDEELDQ
ncbi:MAG: hypothetical protein IPK60_23155 [Sandaracinaceae bacterium]|nr:hypothetical protein [Sandaracinaceae bacterium]